MVQGQHRQKLARPCLTNKLKAKRAGGVAQVTTKKAKKKKKKPKSYSPNSIPCELHGFILIPVHMLDGTYIPFSFFFF
jgi:hypothetical protein